MTIPSDVRGVSRRWGITTGPLAIQPIGEVRSYSVPDLRALAQLAARNPEAVMRHFVLSDRPRRVGGRTA
jgi:hypothetical protein